MSNLSRNSTSKTLRLPSERHHTEITALVYRVDE
jgi:hypothetical protein